MHMLTIRNYPVLVCSMDTVRWRPWCCPVHEDLCILGSWCGWPMWGRWSYVQEQWLPTLSVVVNEKCCLLADEVGEVVLIIIVIHVNTLSIPRDIVVQILTASKDKHSYMKKLSTE